MLEDICHWGADFESLKHLRTSGLPLLCLSLKMWVLNFPLRDCHLTAMMALILALEVKTNPFFHGCFGYGVVTTATGK